MEIQTDGLRAAPVRGPAWGAEGWKASLLPLWSNCTALRGWKLALEKGEKCVGLGFFFFFGSHTVLL